jgi:hypothetical protein
MASRCVNQSVKLSTQPIAHAVERKVWREFEPRCLARESRHQTAMTGCREVHAGGSLVADLQTTWRTATALSCSLPQALLLGNESDHSNLQKICFFKQSVSFSDATFSIPRPPASPPTNMDVSGHLVGVHDAGVDPGGYHADSRSGCRFQDPPTQVQRQSAGIGVVGPMDTRRPAFV